MNIYKTIGANIRLYRKKENMTQIDLAVKAGIDRSFLAKVEAGKRNFSIGVLESLADSLDVSVMDLMDGVK